MAEIFNKICLTSAAASVAEIMGMSYPESFGEKNPLLMKLAEKKLKGRKADRARCARAAAGEDPGGAVTLTIR